MNIENLSHQIWMRVGAPDEVKESDISELISEALAAPPVQEAGRDLIERVKEAEAIMLLQREGKEISAQLAYMDYCGKYLGEPSNG